MNKDALKKHHFWILTGLAPLFVIGAVLLIWTDVGAEVEKEAVAYKKANDALKVNPKGKTILEDYDKQKKILADKRTELWEDNWKRQNSKPILTDPDNRTIKLYDWPRDGAGRMVALEKVNSKFGFEIVDTEEAIEVLKKKDVYEAAYDLAAKSIRPTTFAGGNWRSVLRYVSDWTVKKPSALQVWLALEDLWIQRALLAPIKEVNDAAARFTNPAAEAEKDPVKRLEILKNPKQTFASRVWELELDVSDRKIVKMKLRNKTERLQLLGVSNTMRLKLWLSKAESARPIEVRIEGEFVKSGPPNVSTLEVKPVPALHGITVPADEVQGIYRVEQILDERTVPIRQVANLALNYKDARNADAELKAPLQKIFADDPAATPGGAAGPGGPGPVRPPVGADDDDRRGPGGFPGGVPGVAGARNGDPKAVLDANKKRYLGVSEQVRRMPVAVVLIVDQMFVQDALVAYTNSPLRFQVTQSHWRRFRGTLGTATPDQPTDEGTPISPTGPFGPFGPTGPMGTPFFPGAPGPNSAVAEGQVTSGLVELTIYGLVSLYERYEAPTETPKK